MTIVLLLLCPAVFIFKTVPAGHAQTPCRECSGATRGTFDFFSAKGGAK